MPATRPGAPGQSSTTSNAYFHDLSEASAANSEASESERDGSEVFDEQDGDLSDLDDRLAKQSGGGGGASCSAGGDPSGLPLSVRRPGFAARLGFSSKATARASFESRGGERVGWSGGLLSWARAQWSVQCDFDFEAFGGFGKEVRSTLREAANQLSNKLSHAQHLDEVTWTTKNWHGLQMQRLSVVLHTAVAWQTVNELACGESGIVHGAECIAVLNGVA
ncbi:hypothetical protein EMIHUDRAFT_211876 [Emiliania huxleyi CCMP1516]|uniref:Uncharacterized protein n=2 Tax=Emiliania huxleyi TaxID=2903 RepID=A0A0D3IT38_EMIH1|nr:hypothetical protein EMIHUDRAFT_211876 [Emiliania huxleyi CCMP1516]EOD14423.1 hypothetical protein EMIHUDRAFT_211876 [Emiliania huxleyi CCMP1516]|eukprot:XP_005766852.1 hypothetical protein EMIHUDRAFT_211876 [Emiliania huxleyi CCMP1516]